MFIKLEESLVEIDMRVVFTKVGSPIERFQKKLHFAFNFHLTLLHHRHPLDLEHHWHLDQIEWWWMRGRKRPYMLLTWTLWRKKEILALSQDGRTLIFRSWKILNLFSKIAQKMRFLKVELRASETVQYYVIIILVSYKHLISPPLSSYLSKCPHFYVTLRSLDESKTCGVDLGGGGKST